MLGNPGAEYQKPESTKLFYCLLLCLCCRISRLFRRNAGTYLVLQKIFNVSGQGAVMAKQKHYRALMLLQVAVVKQKRTDSVALSHTPKGFRQVQ
jgi:hypothetical protein